MSGGSDNHILALGFHLGISPDWAVTALSSNVGEFLGTSSAAKLGHPLTELLGSGAIHDIRNRMALLRGDEAVERQLDCAMTADGTRFDLSIYRIGEGFGIDGEPCDRSPLGNVTGVIEGMLARLPDTNDTEAVCSAVARQLRTVTGFDNVAIHLGSQLGGQSARPNSPAPPPPPAAFMSADSEAEPVTILGESHAAVRSDLRAPTSAELGWMRGCEARAAMVIKLSRDEDPPRFATCLHYSPRYVGLQRRSIARLFATISGLRIENAELKAR